MGGMAKKLFAEDIYYESGCTGLCSEGWAILARHFQALEQRTVFDQHHGDRNVRFQEEEDGAEALVKDQVSMAVAATIKEAETSMMELREKSVN